MDEALKIPCSYAPDHRPFEFARVKLRHERERTASEPKASSVPPPAEKRGWPVAPMRIAQRALKWLATVSVLAGATVAAMAVWDYYVVSPWTRDGRVRVQVASVAPQVSGQITEVRVVDNQFVHKDDVLYIVDRFNFQNALDEAKAQVQRSAADYQVKRVQSERRQRLSDLSTSTEQRQLYAGQATQAEADFKSAQTKQAMAEINLARTSVRSPVNGFITNFQMRVGDYAREGTTNIAIIDAESYWLDGYFEETKMGRICVGDRAIAHLMGYREPILGVVASVTRGIAVSDAAPSTQGLPSVDPIYTWVRLAQRVPVRIRILFVPPGVSLVSGMTATVTIRDPALYTRKPWWHFSPSDVGERLKALYAGLPARSNCGSARNSSEGRTVTIRTPQPSPARRVEDINPGMTQMPLLQVR